MKDHPYIDVLTTEGEATAAKLTSPEAYGGAVAHRGNPCLVIYGLPVWIMPNGMCRVGSPDGELVEADDAVTAVSEHIRKQTSDVTALADSLITDAQYTDICGVIDAAKIDGDKDTDEYAMAIVTILNPKGDS